MRDKTLSRLRRARQTRHKIREVGAVRLTVHRTNAHIYALITSAAPLAPEKIKWADS